MDLQEAYDDVLQAVRVKMNYIQTDRALSEKEKISIRKKPMEVVEKADNFLNHIQGCAEEKLEGAFNDAVSSLSTSHPHTVPEVDNLIECAINRIAAIYEERTGQKPSLELE